MSTAISLDQLCVNTIRTLAIDAVQKANSGHPGLPMGAAPMAYVLWQNHLRHYPKNPAWPDRDRFVLSAGHGSMLLYALLHLSGYDVTMNDLLAFRQWGSRTPGHPESFETPGVEATTGPLGQGAANAVGMAIAERMLHHRFNRPDHSIVDHYTYALVSDGDLMEGISAEAASIAGHFGLGKLTYLYDANDVTLDGPASLTFSTEDVGRRYEAYPELASEWERRQRHELPTGWDEALGSFEVGEKLATRESSGKVLNAIASTVPELVGGDADLSSSTKTALKDMGSFDGQTGEGRNVHFGVREHAMGSLVNGMVYHGGVRAYASTFFVFSDYMRPSIRLAALSKLPAIYVWTHDSVGVGEDGPTHQPVEHLMALRVVPNLHVLRPADANETVEAWRVAMERTDGPTALVLTRQKIVTFDREELGSARGTRRGAYVLANAEGEGLPDAILMATGSEVTLALAARELLSPSGIRVRVVSMPCWELFEAETEEYRESVLPEAVKARVSVEAGVTLGWERYLGSKGRAIGIDRFGASAPGNTVFEKLGLTADSVAETVKRLV